MQINNHIRDSKRFGNMSLQDPLYYYVLYYIF